MMNPADSAAVRAELESQREAIKQLTQSLTALAEGIQDMAIRHEGRIESLRSQLPVATAPSRPPIPASEARLHPPERYSGMPGSCRPFLIQCSLAFELQPSAFPTQRSRVAYIVSLLSGRARDWGTAEWEKQASICSSVELFSAELRKVFDHTTPGREAARGLFTLSQGARSVADYSIELRTLAAESNWNATALFDAFYHGLSDRIKDELASRDLPEDLDALIALAIRIGGRLQERRKEKRSPPPAFPSERGVDTARDSPEPMQLGRTRLSAEERQRRLQDKLCMYCGRDDHFVSSCPVKGRAPQSPRGRW